jgi:hypothetical protein
MSSNRATHPFFVSKESINVWSDFIHLPKQPRPASAPKDKRDFPRLCRISQHRLSSVAVFPLSPTVQYRPYVSMQGLALLFLP